MGVTFWGYGGARYWCNYIEKWLCFNHTRCRSVTTLLLHRHHCVNLTRLKGVTTLLSLRTERAFFIETKTAYQPRKHVVYQRDFPSVLLWHRWRDKNNGTPPGCARCQRLMCSLGSQANFFVTCVKNENVQVFEIGLKRGLLWKRVLVIFHTIFCSLHCIWDSIKAAPGPVRARVKYSGYNLSFCLNLSALQNAPSQNWQDSTVIVLSKSAKWGAVPVI